MIRVASAEEPADFHNQVRVPGLRAVAEMVGEKPKRNAGKRFKKIAKKREDIPSDQFPPYWTEALDDLMRAYSQVCAYSCFRIHPVTGARSVDHFAAKSRYWDRVYEWRNYRLACSLLNARKKDFSDVLDPFDIRDGWFRLELVAFQVVPDPTLPRATRTRIEATVDRLQLNGFCKQRAEDADRYWNKDVSLRSLVRESPFVAMELRRQGRLNAADTKA